LENRCKKYLVGYLRTRAN